MKRKSTFVPFGIAVAAIAALTAGTLLYSRSRSNETPAALSTPGSILPETPPTPAATTDNTPIKEFTVYQVVTDDNGSHLKKLYAHLNADTPDSSPPAQTALNVMAEEQNSPLPVGTHVNSYVLNDGGIATVDFNQAFVTNFKGGDEAEALTLNAILSTVGQFGARQVQITVEGKKIDTLGGTQSLTTPLPVPQVSEQTAQSAGNP